MYIEFYSNKLFFLKKYKYRSHAVISSILKDALFIYIMIYLLLHLYSTDLLVQRCAGAFQGIHFSFSLCYPCGKCFKFTSERIPLIFHSLQSLHTEKLDSNHDVIVS